MKLNAVLDNQEKFDIKMNTFDNRISELNAKVDDRMKEIDLVESKKEKGKGVVTKGRNDFYHVNIYNTILFNVLHYIFMPFLILIIA